MSAFFPIFFKNYWNSGDDTSLNTYKLGIANSIASLLLAVLSPILGVLADRTSSRKTGLVFMMILGVTMTGSLTFLPRHEGTLAAGLYILACLAFSGSNLFYDSLLVEVEPKKNLHFISAFGYAMGYLGGGLIFLQNVYMTLNPAAFGLSDATQAIRFTFLIVALWWALFSLPIILWLPENRRAATDIFTLISNSFRQTLSTASALKKQKNILLFLIAYFFYIDGVSTIIRMSVDYGQALGYSREVLITALLITQFIGFPSSLLLGFLFSKLNPKLCLYVAIVVYAGICLFAYQMQSVGDFYSLAVAIGFIQGGIQALSRSIFAQMVPPEKSAEFFGFFNMFGKFSVILGPYLIGVVSLHTGNPRLGTLSLLLLFVAGGFVLSFVKIPSGKR